MSGTVPHSSPARLITATKRASVVLQCIAVGPELRRPEHDLFETNSDTMMAEPAQDQGKRPYNDVIDCTCLTY
jgi:hypothetical protein